MSIEITVTTEGGEAIIGLMDGLDERTHNLQPVFRDIALQIYAEEYMIFEAEGGYRGRPVWPELSDEYAARKAQATRGGETVGGGLGLLELSGRLRASLTSPQDRDAILQITRDGLYLGSKRKVEHKGTAYNLGFLHATGAGTLPVREALTVVDEQVQEWAEIITQHLEGGQQ